MPDSPQHGFRKSGLKRAAVTGWLWNFLIKATSIVLTALVFLITSRLLDPVSFGIVAFGAAVVALIAAVMPVAFGEALVQRQDLQDRHLNSVFWLCLGLAGAAYGLLALSAPLIAAYQENELLVPILLLLGSRLFFDAIGTVPNALLQRRMEFRALAVRSVVANLVGASFCLGLIWLGYPLWGLVASQVASPLVSMVIVVWVTRWHPSGGLDGVALRDVSRFGLYSMGHGVIHQARIDQLLFGMMLGPAMLGLYFFARRLYGLVSDLTGGAFAGVSGVVFATLQSDPARRKSAFTLASFASTSLGFPAFGGLFVLAPTAVPLAFGPQWAEAVVMVQALCVIGVMGSLGIIQAALIRYLGEPGWWFRYQLLVQGTGWGLIVALAPFGAGVVVIAFALRTLLLWPLSVRKTSRLLDQPVAEYLASFAAPAVATLVMVGWVLVLAVLMPDTGPWLLLLAQMGSGLLVYALVLAVLAPRQLAEGVAMWRNRGKGRG